MSNINLIVNSMQIVFCVNVCKLISEKQWAAYQSGFLLTFSKWLNKNKNYIRICRICAKDRFIIDIFERQLS